MKYIILISLFTLSFWVSQAQNIPAQGSYIKNNTMGAFHGTWRWVNGSDTAVIYLDTKKIHFTINGGFDWDCLVGWHKYQRGSTVIESNYAGINNIAVYSIRCGNAVENPNTREVSGSLEDLTKSKSGKITLTLDATGNLLIWKLENFPGVRIGKQGDPLFDWSFTLPKNMVFVKQ